jgi:endonuclease/exonuclease/phosphatase family metal-dependent hydrolase
MSARKPDVVFLQECRPSAELPLYGEFTTLTVNPRKAIALGSLDSRVRVVPLEPREGKGLAMIAAAVTGRLSFTVLGIWSQHEPGVGYVDDVLRSLDAYDDIVRGGPTVVMGDLNSGPKMTDSRLVTSTHRRLLDAFHARNMVSAYHAYYRIDHGQERHHTYRHTRRASEPWHLDFCFVPKQWAKDVTSVEVLDTEAWRAESDHHPLVVDLTFSS